MRAKIYALAIAASIAIIMLATAFTTYRLTMLNITVEAVNAQEINLTVWGQTDNYIID